MKKTRGQVLSLLLVLAAAGGLFSIGLLRLEIETGARSPEPPNKLHDRPLAEPERSDLPTEKLVMPSPKAACRALWEGARPTGAVLGKAVLPAVAGISAVLLLASPRPLLGLLALVPALAGTYAAFFALFLFHRSVSSTLLGFAGALVSMAAGWGISWSLLLAHRQTASGREVAREARSIGLPAVLAVGGSFASLGLMGSPLFKPLGQLVALAMGFSFLLANLALPSVIQTRPAVGSRRPPPLQRAGNALARLGKKGVWIAGILAAAMALLAQHDLDLGMSARKTVEPQTRVADSPTTAGAGGIQDRLGSPPLGGDLENTKNARASLSSAFSRMVLLGAGLAVLLFLFLFDVRLTIIALLPVLFALVGASGTLQWVSQPLGISGLILPVVVLGIGVQYPLWFVRSFQRFGSASHPSFEPIRVIVLASSASALIGFGLLCSAGSPLLRSIGLVSVAGIGYSLAGTFLILPPILVGLERRQASGPKLGCALRERVLWRYRNLEAYPRLFARFKLQLDPMFDELPGLFDPATRLRTVVDIGCGYGVPAVWLLEKFEHASLYGIEPEPARVRIASVAVGNRGSIRRGAAPELPETPKKADLAMMLDMIHHLDEEALGLTLGGLRRGLRPGGCLLIRAPTPVRRTSSWLWWWENYKLGVRGHDAQYRSAAEIKEQLRLAGFDVTFSGASGSRNEMVWVVAKIPPTG